MEQIAQYLFKSSVWLTGFAIVFLLFLRNERFFLLNRLYLITGILASFLFPFISIHYTVILPAVEKFSSDEAVSNGVSTLRYSKLSDVDLILFIAYSIGVLMVAALLIRQSTSVFRLIKRSEIIKYTL